MPDNADGFGKAGPHCLRDTLRNALTQFPVVHPDRPRKIGIVLTNLGTPEAIDRVSLTRFLADILADNRVNRDPQSSWFFLVNAGLAAECSDVSGKSLPNAAWRQGVNDSPLRPITRSQVDLLRSIIKQGFFGETTSDIQVEWGMLYGNPSLESAVHRLCKAGYEYILVLPLHAQFSSATTAPTYDRIYRSLMGSDRQAVLRIAPPYYDDPIYIEALARSIGLWFENASFEPDLLIASFHGMPSASRNRGDPYHDQCQRTIELLRSRLGLPAERLLATFQSDHLADDWLRPFTHETIQSLAERGVRKIAVFSPGFIADSLETMTAINRTNAEMFCRSGGTDFAGINCLNDTEDALRLISSVARRELQGWL